MKKRRAAGRCLAAGLAAVLLAASDGGCSSGTENPAAASSSSENFGSSSLSGGNTAAQGKKSTEGETENLAMYVPYGEDGGYVMVDQETGSVFTVTMPEEILDIDGNLIGPEKLEKGNILRIYGNGIMLESYPGQYPGVTRIQVEETGDPSDADQYQELIDGIWQEPDPSELPEMNVEYTTSLAVVTAATVQGGYQWSSPLADGTAESVIACPPHITEWEFQDSIRLEGPTDLTLLFSKTPDQVTARRWPEDPSGGTAEQSGGEEVEVTADSENGQFLLKQAEPDYRYLVTAEWENGYVEYGFLTAGL